MNIRLLTPVIAAAMLTVPAAAIAQRLTPAPIAVVDTDRITRECTACVSAQAQLRTLVASAQTRQNQLQTSLTTKGTAIQTTVNGLPNKRPDAATEARIRAFETEQTTANQELANRSRTLQSTQAHVNQQISARLLPIIETVRNARGAALVVDKGTTLASASNIDVTSDVLAQLNQQLPAVSVTPLPASAAANTAPRPQGR